MKSRALPDHHGAGEHSPTSAPGGDARVGDAGSELHIPVAAVSTPSLLSARPDAHALTAQLTAIAVSTAPPRRRSVAIPLLAGVLGATAAGVIVFFAIRGPVHGPIANGAARIEATPTGPARTDGTGGIYPAATATTTSAVMGAVTSTSQPGTVAGRPTAERSASPFTTTPPRTGKASAAARESALAAADARRDREKADALTNAAAEVSARSTAATSLAAAPIPQAPEPVAAAAPAAPTKAAVLPFGEGMTRPSSISADEIQFTREAREARVSGTMIVRCLITTEGALQSCRIMKSVPMMDQTVLASLAQHRGAPVMYQGHPVSVEYTYTIRLKSPD